MASEFGLLQKIQIVESTGHGAKWLFVCECGGERVCFPHVARSVGHCGCKTRDNLLARPKKHGAYGTPAYRAWDAMIQRCTNQNHKHYGRYGGRGISVCKTWTETFQAFLNDMGQPPAGMTIERIDNEGDYEPGNCRWATRKEQSRNHSRNRILTLNGVSQPMICWAEVIGLPVAVLRSRLNRGWSVERSLTTPRLSQGMKNNGVI